MANQNQSAEQPGLPATRKYADKQSLPFQAWMIQKKRKQRNEVIDKLKALINSLFSASEQGAFYVPKPIVNGAQVLFQDSSGTVPVTADGDPVGKMLDQSGNNNHATQSVSGSRPVYRTDGVLHWLEFDGVDDYLATSDSFTIVSTFSVVKFLSKDSTVYGSPSKYIYNLAWRANDNLLIRGSGGTSTSTAQPSLDLEIISTRTNGSGDSLIRVGGIDQAITGFSDPITEILWIGIRQGDAQDWALDGNYYGGAVIDRTVSPSNTEQVEAYLAGLAGVTL